MLDDVYDVLSRIPWWVNLGLGLISFGVLRLVASAGIRQARTPEEVGEAVLDSLVVQAAGIAQYLVPFIFAIGAVLSIVAPWLRSRLIKRVSSGSSEQLRALSWSQFEGLVGETFRRQGYDVTRTGRDGPDGGVDLVLARGRQRTLVQCKRWTSKLVGVAVVRELYGVMAAQNAAAGIFVTAGDFSRDAIDFAIGKNLRLIGGGELHEMVVRCGVDVTQADGRAEPTIEQREAVPECSRCGGAMVRRRAKRGTNAGADFWGCSRFPQCWGTRPIGGAVCAGAVGSADG